MASVFTNLGMLCFFKYYGFFVSSLTGLLTAMGFQVNVTTLQVALPSLKEARVFDIRREVAERYAVEMGARLGMDVRAIARRSLEDRRGQILARAAARAAFKFAIAAAICSVRPDDDGAQLAAAIARHQLRTEQEIGRAQLPETDDRLLLAAVFVLIRGGSHGAPSCYFGCGRFAVRGRLWRRRRQGEHFPPERAV